MNLWQSGRTRSAKLHLSTEDSSELLCGRKVGAHLINDEIDAKWIEMAVATNHGAEIPVCTYCLAEAQNLIQTATEVAQ